MRTGNRMLLVLLLVLAGLVVFEYRSSLVPDDQVQTESLYSQVLEHALERRERLEHVTTLGSSFGITCVSALDGCEQLISKAEANPALAAAFRVLKNEGVV